ncbi:MAG: AlbA family DNA-binding domain-containing protein, partial [Candidatus Dormibacteraceae bacterium]
METLSALEIEELIEGADLEVKRAAGRTGQGELPSSFFETYSAMANTHGGVVLLGIEQSADGAFAVSGITRPSRVLKMLFDCLNDRDKVSANLLTDQMVDLVTVQGRTVVKVKIPRA